MKRRTKITIQMVILAKLKDWSQTEAAERFMRSQPGLFAASRKYGIALPRRRRLPARYLEQKGARA